MFSLVLQRVLYEHYLDQHGDLHSVLDLYTSTGAHQRGHQQQQQLQAPPSYAGAYRTCRGMYFSSFLFPKGTVKPALTGNLY